jgi:protein arginine kinase activator
MKCDKCKKNEATIHFTQVKEGEVVSLNLCHECAGKHGMKGVKFDSEVQPAFSPEQKNAVLNDLAEPAGEDQAGSCQFCGSTLDDIKKSGRLGCGKCYFVFESQVDMLMRRIQGSSFHVGKRPGRTENRAIDDQLRVRELKKRLNDAVKLENYEEAARLRDEILTLEKGANSSK